MISDILSAIDSKEQSTIETLQKLVRFRSVNPPGNERECNLWIAERLRDMGFQVQLVEAEPGRPNVLGLLQGMGGGSDLLFYGGHADVVPPGEMELWSYDPFGGEIHDGWIYGRGTADHKGSIAASLTAIEAILHQGVKLRGNLQYLVAVDEESGGMAGTKYLVEQDYLRGDLGIYGGPGDPAEIIIASKGLLQLDITISGSGGHAATPWLVANPIMLASQLVKRLHQMPFEKRSPHFEYPFKAGPGAGGTLSVTKIEAGERLNQVPTICTIGIDRRLIPEESVRGALEEIQGVLRELMDENPEFGIEINKIYAADEGVVIAKEEPIVKILQRAASQLSISTKTAATFATSDTRFIVNQAGIPIAAYGAGLRNRDGQLCVHGPNECLQLSELLTITKVYALAIMEACGISS